MTDLVRKVVNGTDVRIAIDPASLAVEMAAAVMDLAETAISTRGRFLLVLNGGGTPRRLFEELGRSPSVGSPIWPHTQIFWGDERCVPPTQRGSNYLQASSAFLNQVDVPPNSIFRIRGEMDPGRAAEDYIRQLAALGDGNQDWPAFDLVLLGVGHDGHTASLFPGMDDLWTTAPVVPVTADYDNRPANRVSLTPMVFNASRRIMFMAQGEAKSGIVRRILRGGEMAAGLPAAQVDPSRSTWWLDQGAASGL